MEVLTTLSVDPSRPIAPALPFEILLIIFKLVYAENRINLSTQRDFEYTLDDVKNLDWYTNNWDPRADIRAPSLFPYALSSVNCQWRDVLSTLPKYWTRVVIVYDSADFSLSFVRAHLEWSGNFSINITVTRRHSTSFIGKPALEQARLKEVMDVIRTHVFRCQTLTFDVAYPSSLPSLSADFLHYAPHLVKLSLEASVPTDVKHQPQIEERDPTDFPFTGLIALTLSGWTFIDVFKNASWWFHHWLRRGPKFPSLRIVHYHPPPSGQDHSDPFNFTNAIPLLRDFSRLEFDDIHYDCLAEPSHSTPSEESISGQLSMRDLNRNTTKALLANLDPNDTLHISRCPLSPQDTLPASYHLCFDGGDELSPEILQAILSTWEGDELELKACLSFNDDVLDILGNTAPDRSVLNAPELWSLDLTDCFGFSIAALRRMVERRNAHSTADEPMMHLYGLRVPVMTGEDREWFREHTAVVCWCDGKTFLG
ncbi:hypothetical protein D9615_007049 [Tricholomella constricta]|uniref:Uncharacterized protein n=1 Tax=Tricholomella constricta TaxID=117010 RepID=A0A8H5M2F7_9AGAR|nr:hypothetical protein D9615_007049 [Tricholomella constricta]